MGSDLDVSKGQAVAFKHAYHHFRPHPAVHYALGG